jgi:hypothetical protein
MISPSANVKKGRWWATATAAAASVCFINDQASTKVTVAASITMPGGATAPAIATMSAVTAGSVFGLSRMTRFKIGDQRRAFALDVIQGAVFCIVPARVSKTRS